jgi:hypothetical protein
METTRPGGGVRYRATGQWKKTFLKNEIVETGSEK